MYNFWAFPFTIHDSTTSPYMENDSRCHNNVEDSSGAG